jgi:hypothetical protein
VRVGRGFDAEALHRVLTRALKNQWQR